MPDGLLQIIALLAIGYVLLILELFVPGGILGLLGAIAIGYGCYLAFGLGSLWGISALVLSVAVTFLMVRFFLKSRAASRLVLSEEQGKTWKGQDTSLTALVGKEGRTLSMLRPAGLAEIDGERVDVVADSDFLDAGTPIKVVQVEGNRVVVEPLLVEPTPAEPSPAEPTPTEPTPVESELQPTTNEALSAGLSSES